MIFPLTVAALVAFTLGNAMGPDGGSQDRTITGHCYIPTREGQQYIGDRRCFRFDGPRQFTGVWISGDEYSLFFRNAGRISDVRPAPEQVWLTVDRKSGLPANAKIEEGHAYLVAFIGKTAHDMHRTLRQEGYGWTQASGLVLVDRFILFRDLGKVPEGLGLPKVEVRESPSVPQPK